MRAGLWEESGVNHVGKGLGGWEDWVWKFQGLWSSEVLCNWEVLWAGVVDLGSVGIGRGWDGLGC